MLSSRQTRASRARGEAGTDRAHPRCGHAASRLRGTSTRCWNGSAMPGSSCWARRRTAPPNITRWRAEISRRLIIEEGFQFIAVEGDWPSCDRLDRYIKGQGDGDAEDTLQAFDRWPTWMWANEEIAELADWLKDHNRGRSEPGRVPRPRRLQPVGLALRRHRLPAPGRPRRDRRRPARLPLLRALRRGRPGIRAGRRRGWSPQSCEDEAVALLADIRRKAPSYREDDRWGAFRAEQNALVVRDAEAYYRAMVRGGPESWNVRDRHMQETLERLAKFYGPKSRGIVWEHNTHIGDARYTDMAEDGMVNIGQLARERWGEKDAVLVGFSTHRGSVIAGGAWDAPAERMDVPEARDGSWDDLLHRAGEEDKLLLLDGEGAAPRDSRPAGHRRGLSPRVRAPGQLRPHGPVPPLRRAALHRREDRALHPLPVALESHEEIPETFPSGR